MSYEAIVAPVKVRPHPDADRLILLTIAGHQVVTGLTSIQDGDLMVFFPEGGQLSHEFIYENSEYREGKGENKDPDSFGFFESNRRVRTIKLRKQVSEGYAVSPQSLAYTGYDLSKLVAGMTFSSLNGHEICWKYVSPATQRAIARATKQGKTYRADPVMFKRHFDTGKLRYSLGTIPDNSHTIITEKLHGNSGRTGLVLVERPWEQLSYFQRLIAFLWFLYNHKWSYRVSDWKVLTGTRRTILENGAEGDTGFYAGDDFRQAIHRQLEPLLHKGETLYYEIVGYTPGGAPLFKHGIPEDPIGNTIYKKYKKLIEGRNMIYAYGQPESTCDFYVYRITHTNEDGQVVELGWDAVKTRCNTLGVKTVPELWRGYITRKAVNEDLQTPNGQTLIEVCNELSAGHSTLDAAHVREGVCVRIEHENMAKTFKYKGFEFCHLEGIRKNSDDYVDIEEAS